MDRLMRQRQASPHTIASYRDTFRLLMQYAQQRLRKAPSQLTMPDLDTPFLGAFLDHLEQKRDNSARSRNVRLAALHSFFRYVSLHAPECNALAQRVLAMQGWKDRIGSVTLTFSQPTAQHCDGLFAKRGAPAFASFAQALHMRTGAQGDVLTAQAGEFCRAQSGLHGQQQQGSIASSAPGVEVRRGEQSFNFDRREEADRSTHVAFTHTRAGLRS